MLETPIDQLPATSIRTINRLKSINIKTFEDLLNHFPSRYKNYSLVSTISQLQPGERVTIKGVIIDSKNEYTRKGLTVQKFLVQDDQSTIEIIWYNQPYLLRLLRPKTLISVAGEVKRFIHSLVLEAQQYEILRYNNDETVHTGRIIPIYPETYGLSSKILREKIWRLLKQKYFKEIFPSNFVKHYQLIDEIEAYDNIHFPKNMFLTEKARRRLVFDEIAIIQLSSTFIKQEWQKQKVAKRFLVSQKILDDFIKNLPFELTAAQKRCLSEILSDVSKPVPMNRLLQGETGSGKTVVAAAVAYTAFHNNCQTLFMAPTEILAFQHYNSLTQLFASFQTNKSPKIILHTSSSKTNSAMMKTADIIVGTHALIDKKTQFGEVGLVVIDEQHKFGVAQRNRLKEKGFNPHLLTMTATPIPRTIILTFYGELNLSIIDEMPKNRLTVKTYLVKTARRAAAYDWIKKQIKDKHIQAFIVCPFIEISDEETLVAVKAAKKEFEYLKHTVFNDLNLGLLHGKMKPKEKDAVMKSFAEGKINILVSTPVVEVGIDIPNAAIILIEAAERFGLAQLHQLRGRVGRGNKQSYCFLFTEKDHQTSPRLRVFTTCFNGFELARQDLSFRGGGEIYGLKQHGKPNLKIASLTDFTLIEIVKKACVDFFTHYNLADFPLLQKRLKKYKISLISQN